jgi:hypothetical protein
MSRSSARRRPGRRGIVRPIPALIAAAVVCAAVSLYAAALYDRTPTAAHDVAGPTADSAVDALTVGGVADPSRLPEAHATAPDIRNANLTLRVGDRTWTTGPKPPASATTATRTVTVRAGPGRHRPGRLRVVVWS